MQHAQKARQPASDLILLVLLCDHQVKPSAHFEKDLGLDSLDVVELVMAFEEEFCIEIPDNDADKIFSVEDAVNYIAQHPMAK